MGKSRLAPAHVLGRRRSKTRWARGAGGQGLVARSVPPAHRAAGTGAHHLLHCSCPPLAGIYLLAIVLLHLPTCPRPRVPLHSSIPQSRVADGLRGSARVQALRGSARVQATPSICKHLQAPCKRPCPWPLFCSPLACGALTQREWLRELTVLTWCMCAYDADIG